ncbi:unnamed protein product [Litomosoides sigmodontis]|uniref:Uncharacterized protein n=1 Tax=Litomosoides sigmodontis TaxID=42156 RepID=A0A3P6T6E1_LITSI|nr:unnamed protein product [Litomosoides sigmodontis]
MNHVSGRPVFTREQIDKELKQVELLDQILAERGALTLSQLNDVVIKIDKGRNFKSFDDLISFVGLRTNIFEASFDLIRNRSQEFREMFGYLVNFLCEVDQKKRNVETVLRVVMRFNSIVTLEVGGTEVQICQFLREHRNFFILCGNSTVMLSAVCLKIPSVWEREALPTYKDNIRYDKSIVLDGIGKVVSAVRCTGCVKIKVVRGRWTAQMVCALSKNVSSEENLANRYPVGTLVKILAYRAYKAAHPWTATKVAFADISDNIWRASKTGGMDRMLAKYRCMLKDRNLIEVDGRADNVSTPEIAKNKSVEDRASSLFMLERINGAVEEAGSFGTKSVDSEMEMNSDYWKFYDDVIKDEMKKEREIDDCLRDGAKTFRQIFDKLIDGDTFAYYSYMVDFIVIRSHLYEILEGRVWMKSYTFRTEMLKFLRYIDEKSKENITINTLRKLISVNDGNFMEELLNCAENADTFLKFLEKHASLIELAEAFGEQFIFLRGTYIGSYDIFIPKFHFARSRFNY